MVYRGLFRQHLVQKHPCSTGQLCAGSHAGRKDGKDHGYVLGREHPTQHLHKVFPTVLTVLPKSGKCLSQCNTITTSLLLRCSQYSAPRSCGPTTPQATLQRSAGSHHCPQRGSFPADFSSCHQQDKSGSHRSTAAHGAAAQGEIEQTQKNSC